jgi:phosphatidylinositol glycan class O
MARGAITLTLLGLLHAAFNILQYLRGQSSSSNEQKNTTWAGQTKLALYRVMILIVIVTGPSAASTGVLIIIQAAALCRMMESSGMKEVDAPVMAAIWRLVIRHVFFATNHHCSFNRLHYSAAFVATNTFMFHVAGSSLFMNTFGWEIIGSLLVMVLSRLIGSKESISKKEHSASRTGKTVWQWFLFFQWTEILASCVSVSLFKRHLMVWAIFAPRFMFAAVFTMLNLAVCLLDLMLNYMAAT